MPTLHLMVGLPCAGKTTLARQLEQELPALRLTPDEWQMRLFGYDLPNPEHDSRHSLIESIMWGIAARSLTLGIHVILDFGFWARVEREDYRGRAARLGCASEVHFLDVSEEVLFERIRNRQTDPSNGVWNIPEEYLREWIPIFQPPDEAELMRREPPNRF
jgi:predicted kinase